MNDIERDAAEIKAYVREAESLIDELMSTSSKLRIKILQARANPAVAPHEGQAALLRLQKMENSILSGSNDLFRAHDHLSQIAVRMDAMHPTPASGLLTEGEIESDRVTTA